MKRFALALLLALTALLAAACLPTEEEASPPPHQIELREISGAVDSWEDGLLVLTDAAGGRRVLNTRRALVSGRCVPEAGCPVTVAVDAAGAPDAALRVRILAPPPERTEAERLLEGMTLEEKVGQMFLVRCPGPGAAAGELAAGLHLSGFVVFYRDLAGMNGEQVRAMIDGWQQQADLPLFIAVDEEGGDVVRVSLNPALRSAPFDAPRDIYLNGGLEALTADAEEKGRLLRELGFNVDLAPVADVSTGSADFMYSRSLGQDAPTTAAAVAAQVQGLLQGGVAATLKHFPGYGSNGDTHYGVVRDQRPAEVFYDSDLLPFRAGIEAGAGLVLVSHNLVTAFDDRLPASLSPAIHRLLREELDFSGLIVTDDLAMGGVSQLYGVEECAVLAAAAGNDLLLSSDPERQIRAVLQAVWEGRLPEAKIDEAVERVLRAKIKAGLIELPAADEAEAGETEAEDAA
ncbi:MAG: beta-hexosaminidase [Firmicutes bacterium]|nr:beta-hexosaminidase [Bacillota bacterium]